MIDNIYNDYLLDAPGSKIDIKVLNNSLKNNNTPYTNYIKNNWGANTKIPEILNDKHVLYLYHSDYLSSVTELKSFRETSIGGNFTIFLEEINPTIHDFIYIKQKILEHTNKNKIRYVLLFGSVEEVPTVMLKLPSDWEYSTTFNSNSSSASSDIYYGHFGNREMKVIVGRLTPGDNRYSYWGSNTNNNLPKTEKQQNIKNQVDKIKNYTTICKNTSNNLSLRNDSNWTKKILGIASNDGGGDYGLDGLSDNQYMRNELVKFKEMGCTYTELFDSYIGGTSDTSSLNTYDRYGNPSKYDLVNSINKGASLLLYVGHANETQLSTTGFSVLDSSFLSNTNKLFLGCVVGCSLGSHDENFMSLSEEFQTLKDKGSIAMFSSSILQSWTSPMMMQRQLNKTIIDSVSELTIGEIFEKSVNNTDFNNNIDYFYYQLLGDPCTPFILTIPDIRRKF